MCSANTILGPFRPSQNTLSTRARRLRDLTLWVDQEAGVASSEAAEARQNAQHRQLLEHLEPRQMYVGPIPFHDLPVVPNPAFYGRQDILATLERCFAPTRRLANLRVASLVGLGGAGKTQVALKYAYSHIESYDAIFWVMAETCQKLAEEYSRLAISMGLASEGSYQQLDQLRETFKQYLFNVGQGGISCMRYQGSPVC